MKVEPFLLPVSLNLMIAQRFVGMLCPDCKVPEWPRRRCRASSRARSSAFRRIVSQFKPPYQIYHAKGCATCKGHGIVDRTGIYEVFLVTKEMEG